MNTDLTGKGMLDELARALTALLSLMMESVFGEGVRAPVMGGIAAVDIAVLLVDHPAPVRPA